jgi:hypothetical protein
MIMLIPITITIIIIISIAYYCYLTIYKYCKKNTRKKYKKNTKKNTKKKIVCTCGSFITKKYYFSDKHHNTKIHNDTHYKKKLLKIFPSDLVEHIILEYVRDDERGKNPFSIY